MMQTDTLILGAGFGGLELASRLSEAFGPDAGVTLIDQNEGFVFGFSKFELMLGRATLDEVTHRYAELVKPGVTFRQERIRSIDPATRTVVTDRETYEARTLVVALGAEYDPAATPGFVEGGHEFYSVPGAIALHDVLLGFEGGAVVVGVLGQPFKCPPAPCEAAMLLEKHFEPYTERFLDALEQVAPHLPPMVRVMRFGLARDVVDASFANDLLPAWVAGRVGAPPTPEQLTEIVTEFLVAAFEAAA